MYQADPVYSIMLLHVFGALFGVMVSWVLHREGIKPVHEKEKTDRKTGLFAMLGEYIISQTQNIAQYPKPVLSFQAISITIDTQFN